MLAIETRDLTEATSAVSQTYCQHALRLKAGERALDTRLKVNDSLRQPVVRLSYGASVSVSVDASSFPRMYLMMTCTRGHGRIVQAGQQATWAPGVTVPMSAGIDTSLGFDRDFAQRSVRLDAELLEQLCSRWLGHPLNQAIRFQVRPFSAELERTWAHTMEFLGSTQSCTLPAAAAAALDEFLLTLLLHSHPHTFSAELQAPAPAARAGAIKRAREYIEVRAAEALTISAIASHVNMSVRSLQAGFKSLYNTTPTEFLRQVRLQHVRDELLSAGEATRVTAIALRWGFVHLGRFSRLYESAFGELPIMTLRRAASYRR
jgi:AraC-like DNA-binding protein